jgi:hypothetical protein
MDITGEYRIDSSRESVWQALNDPAVLKACIPGCEALDKISDTELEATVMVAIGPVRARFKTRLSLSDLKPPESYTLTGESKAGAAGFGRGSARVTLIENEGGTLLRYTAEFKVGGKLAQVGSRLVLGATKKTADDFFGQFSRLLDPAAVKIEDETPAAQGGRSNAARTWIGIGGAVAVLLIWWFLLR